MADDLFSTYSSYLRLKHLSIILPMNRQMGQKSNADRAKISSFLKQMNLYGFVGTRTGRNSHCDSFYHPSFARDNRDACLAITRIKLAAPSDLLCTPESQRSREIALPPCADQLPPSKRSDFWGLADISERAPEGVNVAIEFDYQGEDGCAQSAAFFSELRVRLEESFHGNLSSNPAIDFTAISPGLTSTGSQQLEEVSARSSDPTPTSRLSYESNSDIERWHMANALLDLSRGSSAQSSAWNSRVASPNSRRIVSGSSAFNDFLPTYGDDSCEFECIGSNGVLKGTSP